MHLHAALVTALTSVLLLVATILVGRARGIHRIEAPATTGQPDFERVFRAQANTLEQAVAFLPVLWLATIYSDERWAAGFGYLWLVGRAWYIVGYAKAASRRSMGFLVGALAFMALLAMSLWGIGRGLLSG
jgi:preprotein translocase subunit SecG